MIYLFQSLDLPQVPQGAPLIWYVITAISSVILSLGIPKILEVYRDNKCEKKYNKMRALVIGALDMMDLFVTSVAEEFPDKPGLEQASVKMQEKIDLTIQSLNDDKN